MIDGARIITPELLHFALHGAGLYERAVVFALGWYLGYDMQRWSMRSGYDQVAEDALLAQIDWPKDGYRLFEIGTPDESSVEGWFRPVAEANALFLRREMWTLLGGMDERFDAPGGGLVNLDTYSRAVDMPDAQRVILLGEGTFHQFMAAWRPMPRSKRAPTTSPVGTSSIRLFAARPFASRRLNGRRPLSARCRPPPWCISHAPQSRRCRTALLTP